MTERVEIAAIDDPANQIDEDGSTDRLCKMYVFEEHCLSTLSSVKGVRKIVGRKRYKEQRSHWYHLSMFDVMESD